MSVKTVALGQIRPNPVALRDVNRKSEEYLGLIQSIRNRGFFGAITAREKVDPDTNETYYELIDGLHRYSAAKDAGLAEINVDVMKLDDVGVLETQILANVQKVDTRPIEYSKQLQRLLTLNPTMTEAELAQRVGKSPQWIAQRLGLNKIDNSAIQTLIDEGKINLTNAYGLAKLPPEEMPDYVDRACTMAPDEFMPLVQARTKEIRDAKRKGQDAPPQEFQPVAHMRKMGEIKEELDTSEKTAQLCEGLSTPLEGFTRAIEWVLHLDPASVEIQRAKDAERRAAREEAARKRAIESAKKKEERAAKAAAEAKEAQEALAAMEAGE